MSEPRPTVPELLELVADEEDPDERAELLSAAEKAALCEGSMRASYLILVAGACADCGDEENAHRLLELALDSAEDRVWDYRNAAKAWLQLESRERALEALERFEEPFWNDGGPGYLWRLLAEGFANDLGDAEGAARCLARAASVAETVDDHCSVATGLWNLAGDREGAEAALSTALSLAERREARQAWWTIANAYSSIGDELSVRTTLLRGSEVARSVDEHLVMASAWQSQFPGVPEAVAALRAAQKLASTAGEYLEVAEANYEQHGGEAAVRECLEAALEGAEGPDDLNRVARGFRQWLDEAERADSIAPAGARPQDLHPDGIPLEGWEPAAQALLEWLRPQMTHERVATIAKADYGMDFDRHLVAVQEIVDSGLIPQPLDWHPQEVLHLSRWSQGVNVDHVVRAFCAVVIMLAEAGDFGCSDADPVILLESCIVLGEDALSRSVGLYSWYVAATSWHLDDGIVEREVDAVLALLLAAANCDSADPRLEDIASEVLRTEGLETLMTDSMRDELWLRLAGEILPHAVARQPSAADLQEVLLWVETLAA